MSEVQKDTLIDTTGCYFDIIVDADVFDVLFSFKQYHITGTTNKIIYMCNNLVEQKLIDSLVIDDVILLSQYNDWFKIIKRMD